MERDSRSDGPALRPGSTAWWFSDRGTGATVVAQFPNAPLWILLALLAIRPFLAAGSAAKLASGWLGAAALGWWATDELIRGVNPWRRLLGGGGLVLTGVWVVGLISGS